MGLRALLGLNRKLTRMPAGPALRRLAQHYASKVGKRRLGDLVAAWAHNLRLDTWLADYHIEWYETGTPPPIAKHQVGAPDSPQGAGEKE